MIPSQIVTYRLKNEFQISTDILIVQILRMLGTKKLKKPFRDNSARHLPAQLM
jgi:hypothetical protein